MIALFKALQVLLALVILITVHELGHFLFAKLFHIRVEKFYLFFDINGKHLLKFKKGDTEYGIGVLPLGGYCKIAGMVDESMDLDQLKSEPQPWEFRSHPAWQRLLVMGGGVFFNFILAILVYSLMAGLWGTAYIPNEGAEIYPSPLAADMGFCKGDHILYMDDYIPENFGSLQADLLRRDVHKVGVLRGADTVNIYMDKNRIPQMLEDPAMFGLALPFVVDSVAAGPNFGVLQPSDRFLAIADEPVTYLQDALEVLGHYAGQTVPATLERGTVEMAVDSLGRIGVFIQRPMVKTRSYSALECIPQGVKMVGSTISGYLKDLRMVATPSTGAYKSVGSFIAIGQIFPSTWDWAQFLNTLALLSIMLGVMNLLPIPGLDGGHIFFTLVEIVSGRKPSVRFLAAAQMVGMFLLMMLMVLAFGNDITRLFR